LLSNKRPDIFEIIQLIFILVFYEMLICLSTSFRLTTQMETVSSLRSLRTHPQIYKVSLNLIMQMPLQSSSQSWWLRNSRFIQKEGT